MYRMCVRYLGRLPWEVRQIPKPGDRAPHHQWMLALAMLAIDSETESKALRQRMDRARTPAKWQRIHAKVNRARAVLDSMRW